MVPDYYALLGVSPDANADAVRRAYRKAALRLHPDRNGGSPAIGERMLLVNEAWAALRDTGRRAEYDRRRREVCGLFRSVDASARSDAAWVWMAPTVFVSPDWTGP